jgi:cytidylate kinase
LQARDERDTNRAVAPLAPASDAHLLDTSEMGVDQAVDQVLAWYSQK